MSAAQHWRVQRITALALIPLTLWFVVSLLRLPDFTHATVQAWLAAPACTVLAMLLVACLCWHSMLGVQVVVEDYIPAPALRSGTLLASGVAHGLLGVCGGFAILRIALAG